MTFKDPSTTKAAFDIINGKVVARRTYVAYKLSDFLEIKDLPQEYSPPEIAPFVETVCILCTHKFYNSFFQISSLIFYPG